MLDIVPQISVPFIRRNERGKIVVTDRGETLTLFSESYGMEKHGISKAREENIVGESEARSKAKD